MTVDPQLVGGDVLAFPEDSTPGLRDLVEHAGVDAVLLAVHAKVLRALSGDHAVTAWHATTGAPPRPFPLQVRDGSWRDLVGAAHAALLADPLDDLQHGPPVPARWLSRLSGGPVPRARLVFHADPGKATRSRVAGYHRTALAALAADPDSWHQRCSLVSSDEVRWQLTHLAGPVRVLPDVRAHELIEEQARRRPDATAAVHRTRAWTYAELNSRANRIAAALHARGAAPEDVVAVVTERNLDWLAAVLGVLKAGACYLPVEHDFPVPRIVAMLRRGGARFVVGAPDHLARLGAGSTPASGPTVLSIPDAYAATTACHDPGTPVTTGQLAYIYFTSGSTGEPKGAMCEHAGMLNHLFAKLDDMRIGVGTRVAQTASQCFDISLWQLLAPLLVGGRTHIVEPAAIADPAHFLDVLAAGAIEVVQVVPSYLDMLLRYLAERPYPLPALRCISVTGEAVGAHLVERCLTVLPTVRLVNAYGLTETCDDTNHEVLDRVPAAPVPVGSPLPNVRIHVLDEQQRLVPFGAPGELAFSGICVGRGYVNDAARTALAFQPDPYVAGQRMYRSGDLGRWLPDGRLAFLGRLDNQVKVRGFRIELEEIENRMLRVPGVHAAAVIVTSTGDGVLAGFFTGTADATNDAVCAELLRSLPAYMVPTLLHRIGALPLTGNGKLDRQELARLAAQLRSVDGAPPGTPTERRLAAAWAEVLDLPADRIRRTTHFFASGGTSLSAIRMILRVDRRLSAQDVAEHPVLADLAATLDDRGA